MNYNPLENKRNLYDIYELFIEDKEAEWDWERVKPKKDILKRFKLFTGNYDYLLFTISEEIEWFIKSGFRDSQGDIFYLGKDKDEKYYFLNQGYGSCNSNDVYEANRGSIKKLDELRESMKRRIIQFDSIDEFKNYLESEESKGNHYWYDLDFKDFANKLNNKFGWNIQVIEEN